MRIKIIFFFLIALSCLNGQENKDSVTLKQAPIFPGCEQYMGNNNNLIICFKNKFQVITLKYLDTEYPFTVIPKKQLSVKIDFTVGGNGEVTDIEFFEGDLEIRSQTIQAFRKAAASLKEKGIKIIPAIGSDDHACSLIFRQPIILLNPDYPEDLTIYLAKKGYSLEEIKLEFEKEKLKFNEKRIKRLIKKAQKFKW